MLPVEKMDNGAGFAQRVSGLPWDAFFGGGFSKTGTIGKSMISRLMGRISTFPATMIMSMSICSV
jgi:hypothetical protein